MVGNNTLRLYGCNSIYGYYFIMLNSLRDGKNEQARKMYANLAEDQQNGFEAYLKKAAKPKDLKLGYDATLEILRDLHA